MRARTTVVLLEPATKADRHTEEVVPDWSQDPAEHEAPAAVEPIGSSEQVLTSGTVTSRWTLMLDPRDAEDPEAVARLASTWRVRWRGRDLEVDGDIDVWENRRRGEVYRSCVLKAVQG